MFTSYGELGQKSLIVAQDESHIGAFRDILFVFSVMLNA